jgi:hypothetical protein
LRVFQHVGHTGRVLKDVDEFHCMAITGIGCTSRLGVGSGGFSEDPHAVAHRSSFWLP